MDIQLVKNTNLPKGHARQVEKKTGVLLINLGTPDATNYAPCDDTYRNFYQIGALLNLAC